MDERWNDAMEKISDRHIEGAAAYRRRRPYWLGAVAAMLALALCLGLFRGGPGAPAVPTVQGTEPMTLPVLGTPQAPDKLDLSALAAAPTYPQMPKLLSYEHYENFDEYYAAEVQWAAGRRAQYDQPEGYADSLDGFFRRSIPQFLSGADDRAYSPLNVYMALAMLAEVTDGSSRQQILDLLGLDSIEALRTQADHVWNAHFCDDGPTSSLLANSLWLDEAYGFHPDTVQTLAQQYYSSVFHGDLGTEELDQQLRAWLDSQTGGLLQEQSSQLELPEETVFALASTIFFSSGWTASFSEEDTAEAVFHCKDRDLLTPFMNQTITFGTYYRGKDFGAVGLGLDGSNAMWLILPDEGIRVEEVLESGEYLTMTRDPLSWENKVTLTVHLSLPKFDISSHSDLIDGMKKLGVTDVFDETRSDFSPITDTPELFVSNIDHAVRVAIDEEGVTAAAYTVIITAESGAPALPEDEIHFTLDRPFLFMITSQDRLPLFAGVVEHP